MMNSQCKRCRRVGEKLFLKGEKCYTPKCSLIRHPLKSKKGSKLSVYGRQLQEKQKIKLFYNIREAQLKRYYNLALKGKTSTPLKLAQILESRFDTIIMRSGLSSSQSAARQLVTHGHFLLNGRPHNIPSTILKPQDVITLKTRSAKLKIFEDLDNRLKNYKIPSYIKLERGDNKDLTITLLDTPKLEELSLPFDFTAVVEFYSR
ncbi:MAG: 30S ribosomal protein S4 [Parcubacteria group bacterium ADurb.Bin305]|nr:30S ribosomal protein S4 [Candidatus Paceibacterota bacterium]OQA44261.1 MAG: 30S ribosomal protein S4 [Parcubacteria group bacterium ADurb.Bin305]